MSHKTLHDWTALASRLSIEGRAFIDGVYCASGDVFLATNPANKKVLARVSECGEFEVNRAVDAARRVFHAGSWSRIAPFERKIVLLRLADLITRHADELALLETLDTGRPISNAINVDVANSAYCVQRYADACDSVMGDAASLPDDHHGMVVREPVGVVAAIVPWNFPLLLATSKVAAALAAGNSVILKPSERSPLSAIRLAQLAHQAGVPDGVFNVLPGSGNVGRLLGLHQDIDCVSFTGSTAVARLVMRYSAESNLKAVWLELGGRSPNIVLDDCDDIGVAATRAADAIFYNQGQACTVDSRILVHRWQYGPFTDAFLEAVEAYRPQNPLDPDSKMGAIIDETHYRQILDYISSGQQDASLLRGGVTRFDEQGYFVEPTVFEATPKSSMVRGEVPGPVSTIVPFDSESQAISLANDALAGHATAVWTRNIGRAHGIARKLRAGTVWINCYEERNDMTLAFPHYRQAGRDKGKSMSSLDRFTELKSTVLKLRCD